ncbi:MAG: ATP-binding protein [Elusimicrobia bacterium]|nr:ATP-binding protein [Elusimicrobiota bacterium]
MSQRDEWFGGPVEGVVFALIMAVAAFLGRENPRFVYPEVLYCLLALLAFNLVNFSALPRLLPQPRRSVLVVASNILLLTLVLHYSGGAQSYFWVLYLLPVFNACLAFGRRGVLATIAAALAPLLVFYLGTLSRLGWGGAIELLVKAAIITASAAVVMQVAGREREARARLEEERRRSETERVQAREQLQHMDRLATLGTLIAGVAHELKSPMAGILGYAELAHGRELPPAEAKRIFGRIAERARNCEQVIQDMLAFARQKTGARKACDINALIRECVALKEHDWFMDRLAVDAELSADLPRTELSGAEFQQVIFNLLTNAHQAIRAARRADGRIRLSTRREDGEILVRVEDNGPGIPADIAERIWEPFFTTKPEGEGTGLGLAICRRIVDSLGGSLTLQSGRGEGAAFLIRLPIVAEAEAAGARPGQSLPGAGT